MIDSHCHLAGSEFASDLDQVVARARDAGLVRCLVVLGADDDEEIRRAARVRAVWPEVRFAIGVHPHNAHHFASRTNDVSGIVVSHLDAVDGACAIGEIGLDYHYDFSPRPEQQAVFRAQLRLALDRRLPVVIHTREAEIDTLAIIEEEGAGRLSGVFHCFSGDAAAARRALHTGFYLSIPGIATFPRSTDLREAVRMIPTERLLIETDSPYLAPVPHRGKRNEPSFVMRVLETVADVRQLDSDVLGPQLVSNFDALFGEGE